MNRGEKCRERKRQPGPEQTRQRAREALIDRGLCFYLKDFLKIEGLMKKRENSGKERGARIIQATA